MPYKNPEDKRKYMRDYMAKKRHDKKVEKKIGLTGRIDEDDLKAIEEPRTRKVDSIEDRPDFILERNLKELYDEIPEEDRVVHMYGSHDPGPDPYQLDCEISDNDLIIDLDDLENWETGKEYKKRRLVYSRT